MSEHSTVPNHHAHYPGFAGPSGLVAALSMIGGRHDNARLAAELCSVAPGDTIVDVGCGPGAAARYASRLGATVVGVDPAPIMLRVARIVHRSRSVRYVEGSAERLPVDTGWASVVWTIACVHHWNDVDDGIGEVCRVLQPGGRFLAIERARQPDAEGLGSHGWTPEQAEAFADACTRHGFLDVRTGTHDGRPTVHTVIARATD